MHMAGPPSTPYFGMMREEDQMKQQIQASSNLSSLGAAQTAAPVKKKRNQPGTPIPADAEVVALSPGSLMAANRFVCEACGRGFRREQNLQLHRRGHNLPWRLRQEGAGEGGRRRRVYLCPEPTCAHHEPSRALGDLAGVKKHFSRKHGEKRWRCDRCSRRYAVRSDWRAHSRTCGTREYPCDCGTLFSRRDSFITHRAFCDALAQERARLPTSLATFGSHLYGNGKYSMSLSLSHFGTQPSALGDQTHPSYDLHQLGGAGAGPGQFTHLYSQFDLQQTCRPFHHAGLMQLHELRNNTNLPFNLGFFPNGNDASSSIDGNSQGGGNRDAHLTIPEQFGNGDSTNNETTSLFVGNMMNDDQLGGGVSSLLKSLPMHQNSQAYESHELVLPHMSATALLQKAAQMGATTRGANGSTSSSLLRGFPTSTTGSFDDLRSQMESETHDLQDLMNSLADGSTSIFQHSLPDELTRDFLGVGVGSMHHGDISDRNMGSLDSEMKSASTSARSFGSGSMQ